MRNLINDYKAPKPPRSGFSSLVTGFIGFTFFAVLVGVLAPLALSGTPNQTYAENEARTYSRTLYPEHPQPRVACQGMDTDANGYVSCTLVTHPNSPPIPIECANRYAINNTGCRPMRYTVPPSTVTQ